MRTTLRRIARRSAPLLATGLVLAACGSDPEEQDEVPAAVADDEPEETAQDATVRVAGTDLGEVLVDGEGRTLYLFDPDEQGESTCYDDCAASWPPLLDDDPVAGDGADEGLLATVAREDGSLQVTYDDWPLYHWVGDEQSGDVQGQGVQDVWWVLAADGQPLRDAADGDDPAEEEQEEAPSGY
jgi:predicted lipoprotein with Yx(FWY)xxD motif